MVNIMKKSLNLYENIKDNQKIYINNSLINFKIYLRDELEKYNIKTFIKTDKDFINVIFIDNNDNINLSLKKSLNLSSYNCYQSLNKINYFLKNYLIDNEIIAKIIYCLLRINYIKNNI